MADRGALAQDGTMASEVAATSAALTFRRPWRIAALSLPAAVVVSALLLLPMFRAGPSHLTSDESLYLAEAYNIAAGKGFTYPSGETITHRAPLFPLLVAPAIKAGGTDAAYEASKLIVAINAVLVLWLAWRLAGPIGGAVGGVAAAASAFLAELGTTLYLDPAQCSFLLLGLIALHWAVTSGRLLGFAASGVAVGLAFLVKESAIQWAPLGIVAVLALPSARTGHGLRGACLYTAGFLMATAPWFAWVYVISGEVFLVGEPGARTFAALGAGGVILIAMAVAATAPAMTDRITSRPAALFVVVAITLGWGGFILYGLTAYSTWPYPNDYASTIPRYLVQVGSLVQPYVFIIAAWAVIAALGCKRDETARLLMVAALLYTPFALFAANRWLQLRDALPLVYLSYVALGVAAARVWMWMKDREVERPLLTFGAAAACGLAAVYIAHGYMTFQNATERESSARDKAGSWDSPYTETVAAWMRSNIPAGARVATSRLYFSSLHVQTEGQYRIDQLPTVRVNFDAERTPFVEARSNLFRWGETGVRPTAPDDTWLHFQQFSGKSYWVGLSQQELLEYVGGREIDYVILTGEDAAFSSNAFAWFLTAHPAFSFIGMVEGTGGDLMFGYAVDRSKLDVVVQPTTTISPRDYAQLSNLTGLTASELSRRLGTELHVTDLDGALSQREQEGARRGTRPGRP